ncbi:DUF6339 family protein [Actinoplanes auranticolor]|uniref:Uncharacterized protein n=1 Tax=Actinoplanes auranticolor TaxID=47988 RepID=A0A919VST5_9ACTN|nr:DUF6339 family protein [Actinoplanes auranticolor]GIM74532.1 hypothetical protein Aau02nite_61460 [Actinoplanes auranticolor]
MDSDSLRRFRQHLSDDQRRRLIEHIDGDVALTEPVRHRSGADIGLNVVDDLMASVAQRSDGADWAEDRAASDRWLAPRLHYALRLTRVQASDRVLWTWLAVRHHAYVTWRWADSAAAVNDERWNGPVQKQAMMRLWWGAELFRNGDDYTPVLRAFLRQDFPNSYLHRPFVRCRSLALALLEIVAPANGGDVRSATEINDLARVLNLVMAGSPPELETGLQQDDHAAFDDWTATVPAVPADWEILPRGPAALDVTEASLVGARLVAARGWDQAVAARALAGGQP